MQSFVHRGSGVNHSGQLEIKTLISTGVVAAHAIAKERRKMLIQINVVIESN